jgi:hypothetical protein
LRDECLVAHQVELRLLEQTLIVRKLAFILLREQLVGPVVDLREQIALFDMIAFLEGDLQELAVDLGPHRDRRQWRDRAEAGIDDLDIAGADCRHADRLRRPTGVLMRRALCRCGVEDMIGVIANAAEDDEADQKTEE